MTLPLFPFLNISFIVSFLWFELATPIVSICGRELYRWLKMILIIWNNTWWIMSTFTINIMKSLFTGLFFYRFPKSAILTFFFHRFTPSIGNSAFDLRQFAIVQPSPKNRFCFVSYLTIKFYTQESCYIKRNESRTRLVEQGMFHNGNRSGGGQISKENLY